MLAFYKKPVNNKNIVDLVPENLKDKRFGQSGKDERFLLENNDELLYNIKRIHRANDIITILSSKTIGNDKKCQLIDNDVFSKVRKIDLLEGGLMDDWNFE